MVDSASAIPARAERQAARYGVTTARPSPLYRDVPTVAQAAVPGFAYPVPVGFLAPTRHAAQVIVKINGALGRALASETVRSRLNGLGFDAAPMTPEEFDAFMADEVRKYTKIVKDLGLQKLN